MNFFCHVFVPCWTCLCCELIIRIVKGTNSLHGFCIFFKHSYSSINEQQRSSQFSEANNSGLDLTLP
jgi:hypothetical protein